MKIISAAALLLAASAAHADITVFTSQSAYLAAAGNTGVELVGASAEHDAPVGGPAWVHW